MDDNPMQQSSFSPVSKSSTASSPVECLGIKFSSDDERQKYFKEKLKEKLKDSAFRQIEGFPIGDDDDILALSDPPYYTACPNPFIGDFIRIYAKPLDKKSDSYRREPFATDVSEGKSDPIYNAHSYHTKVPHKAIMRYILYYTDPGDIVFDGFCGTGMTGVAAQLCGDKVSVESLGYRVDKDGTISQQETEDDRNWFSKPFSKLGPRRPVLNDLSPAATFIAYNYITPFDVNVFESETKRVLKEVKDECGWMYETLHTDGKTKCMITYSIWSDIFVCPDCASEIVFWDVAVDQGNGVVRSEFECPKCKSVLSKRALERAFVTFQDSELGTLVRQAKQVPVRYTYTFAGRTYTKKPDKSDFALLDRIEAYRDSNWFPSSRMPEGDESRRNDEAGITHTHHFYTKRNRITLAALLAKCKTPRCKWLITGVMQRASKQHQIAISRIGGPKEGEGGATAGHRRGTLYIPSNQVEFSPILLVIERLKMSMKAAAVQPSDNEYILSTASATQISLPDNVVDYIFTDPPFGGNIMYSELNFVWESVLETTTNSCQEAITNNTQGKRLADYQDLMYRCFSEYFRILRPGHWMTVEFHNSQNSVWISIQEALQKAGFVIADVRLLDKKIKTHTQRTAGGSVNKDLAITAYKPNGGLEDRFRLEAGTQNGVWDFVRTHLKQLPVFVSEDGQAQIIAERQNHMLYDRMVAFHVRHGVLVPLSAAEFYAGMAEKFPERDSMFFLPEQATQYEKKRMTVKEFQQLTLIVKDESSAIQWLRQSLYLKPQTFQDLHPQFMREIGGWLQFEKPLELKEMLEQNFICYEGTGDVPSQIHSYLSSDFHEFRGLTKDNPLLKIKAKDRWYVPDPNKAIDLEKLRDKSLLREFQDYVQTAQKRLKVFRLEAIRVGFKRAWAEADYKTVVNVSEKLPPAVLEEDQMLLMWYSNAQTRLGEKLL